eukprot:15451378-Alexandrium_andersonii.AAC.1
MRIAARSGAWIARFGSRLDRGLNRGLVWPLLRHVCSKRRRTRAYWIAPGSRRLPFPVAKQRAR